MREIMRKLLMAGLVAVMVFAFAGCTSGEDKSLDSSTTTKATEPSTTEAADGYDIMAGSELSESGSEKLLYGNDFLLIMPNNDKWGYEKTANDCLEIYLKSARKAGFGGNLVSIMAFDPEDSTYESFPDYSVAGTGQNVNKTFIALFPTDVQYDPQDAQQEADYQELFTHVKKISEGMADSPFQTADSNPE